MPLEQRLGFRERQSPTQFQVESHKKRRWVFSYCATEVALKSNRQHHDRRCHQIRQVADRLVFGTAELFQAKKLLATRAPNGQEKVPGSDVLLLGMAARAESRCQAQPTKGAFAPRPLAKRFATLHTATDRLQLGCCLRGVDMIDPVRFAGHWPSASNCLSFDRATFRMQQTHSTVISSTISETPADRPGPDHWLRSTGRWA